MKKFISLCLLMASAALNASAQFVEGTAATKASQESFTEEMTGWDGLKLSIELNDYNMPDVEIAGRTEDNINTATTVHLSYLRGFILSQKKPVYLETGFGLKWGHYNETYEDWITDYTGVKREELNTWTIEVPVNVGYRITNPNSELIVAPYTGIYMRMHLGGNIEAEDPSGYKAEANIFDEDEFYPAFDRFQFGWQLGCDLQYNQLVFGVSYGIDFNKVWIDTRVFTSALNLGYRF